MTEIHYNYAANFDSLDAITSTIADVNQMKDEVSKVVKSLDGLYDGDARIALEAAHDQMQGKLDDVIQQLTGTTGHGNDAQHENADLDKHLAGRIQI
jgi:hypothetical protein